MNAWGRVWRRLVPSLITVVGMTIFVQFYATRAQQKPVADVGPATPRTKADPIPELPDKNRADILAVQLKMMQMQSQYGALQQQLKQLQDEFQKAQGEYATVQAEACKAAKADCEKQWTLNVQTLKFEKKASAPTPEKKP